MPVKKKMHNSVFHCPAILPFVKHKLSTWFPTCPRRLSATLLACQHSLRVIVRVKKHNATQLALHGATLLACENHRCQPVLHMCLWMVRQFRLRVSMRKNCGSAISLASGANTTPHIHHDAPQLTTIIHLHPHNIGRLSDKKPVATKPYPLYHNHIHF
jgi:hypothetical protein